MSTYVKERYEKLDARPLYIHIYIHILKDNFTWL